MKFVAKFSILSIFHSTEKTGRPEIAAIVTQNELMQEKEEEEAHHAGHTNFLDVVSSCSPLGSHPIPCMHSKNLCF